MGEPNRHVEFEACFNFRDLGGYETVDGRAVRWGHVYRSDMFHRMTEADRVRLAELGLRTVIDLRSSEELDRFGRFDHHEVDFHHHPLFEEQTTSLPPLPSRDDPEPDEPAWVYLLIAEEGAASIANAMRVLADGDHPAVFHCAAGKDRTGMVAALLLDVLGIPEDVIVADYELTELSLSRQLAWLDRFEPETAAEIERRPPWLLASSPRVIRSFLDGLRQRHGSPRGYLRDAGVGEDTIDELRGRLLV